MNLIKNRNTYKIISALYGKNYILHVFNIVRLSKKYKFNKGKYLIAYIKDRCLLYGWKHINDKNILSSIIITNKKIDILETMNIIKKIKIEFED